MLRSHQKCNPLQFQKQKHVKKLWKVNGRNLAGGSAKCNATIQRFKDQTRMILKKGWFSHLEALEICERVNRENMFNKRLPKGKHNPENHNISKSKTTTTTTILIIFSSTKRNNIEVIQKIMTEEKEGIKTRKKVKLRNKMMNKLSKNKRLIIPKLFFLDIPTDNVIEMNDLKKEKRLIVPKLVYPN